MESRIEIGQEQNHIKKKINNLKEVKIIHTNYKQYTDIVRYQCEIMETQILSLMSRYNALSTELSEKENNDRVKQMLDGGTIAPMELYNLRKELLTVVEDMHIWKCLQSEMLEVIFFKLTTALGSVKALDIEREVTQGLRDMNAAYFGFMKEFVIDRHNQVEKKVVDFQNQINSRFDTLTHKNTALIASKIIEAQSKDAQVTMSASEMNDINKIGEDFEHIPSPKPEKLKEDAQLECNDIDGEEEDELKCTECSETFDTEGQRDAHMMLKHDK